MGKGPLRPARISQFKRDYISNPRELSLTRLAIKCADCSPGVSYFGVREADGRTMLSPVVPDGADRVREKLQEMGLGPEDTREEVRWARRR